MSDFEQIQAEYTRVYPDYQRLAQKLKDLLRERLDTGGLRLVEVSARAKEPGSFVKKALRKGYSDPMTSIGDKAGARLVLPFARDRERVLAVCEEVLKLSNPQDKIETYGAERFTYLGLHYDATIRPSMLAPAECDLAGMHAEVQIHTKAESAWATAAHDSLYKASVPVPQGVARRLNRLAALAEIFDDQVERFLIELAQQPGYAELEAILPGLDELLLWFTPRGGDQGLSAHVIPAVATLYDCPAAEIVPTHVRPYVEGAKAELVDLYKQHEIDDRANPLLYQPEALLLFERLARDPHRLRGAWPPEIEIRLLERLAVLRGIRLS